MCSICVGKVFVQLTEYGDVRSGVVVKFVREKDAKKQGFLMAQEMVQGNPDCCVYDDVHTLIEGHALCARHRGNCVVKGCRFFGSGFSCVSISRYNVHAPEHRATVMSGGNATAGPWRSWPEFEAWPLRCFAICDFACDSTVDRVCF